jgi:hypothetical protein
MGQSLTSFGLKKKTDAGLKIAVFSLSYVHKAPRQVKHKKILPDLLPQI